MSRTTYPPLKQPPGSADIGLAGIWLDDDAQGLHDSAPRIEERVMFGEALGKAIGEVITELARGKERYLTSQQWRTIQILADSAHNPAEHIGHRRAMDWLLCVVDVAGKHLRDKLSGGGDITGLLLSYGEV